MIIAAFGSVPSTDAVAYPGIHEFKVGTEKEGKENEKIRKVINNHERW